MYGIERLIRSASLTGYIELVKELGADPHIFLRETGLSARLLENPETLIPSRAVRELLELTANRLGIEDFALRLAADRPFSNLGPISLVLKEEPTPRAALDTLCHYLRLLSAALVTHIEETEQSIIIREELIPMQGISMRQATELVVAIKVKVLRELIGPSWQPKEIYFTHRAPQHLPPYRAFFGMVPKFSQTFNGIVCHAQDLYVPNKNDNKGMSRFARDFLDTALKNRGSGVPESCKALMLILLPQGRCTAEQVANLLRIDRRTLHRYLQQDNQTFSTLLKQVRLELVQRYIMESDLPISEVSALLGFASSSSFSHWFKAEKGLSVSDWRQLNPK